MTEIVASSGTGRLTRPGVITLSRRSSGPGLASCRPSWRGSVPCIRGAPA